MEGVNLEFTMIQMLGIVISLIGVLLLVIGILTSKDKSNQDSSNKSSIPLMTIASRQQIYGSTEIKGKNQNSYTNIGAPSYTLSNSNGSLNIINKASKVFGREDFQNIGNPQELGFVTRKSKGGHFKITMAIGKYGEQEFFVEDLRSSNGTFLNNIDISKRGKVELRNGDIISPGGTLKIEFKIAK